MSQNEQTRVQSALPPRAEAPDGNVQEKDHENIRVALIQTQADTIRIMRLRMDEMWEEREALRAHCSEKTSELDTLRELANASIHNLRARLSEKTNETDRLQELTEAHVRDLRMLQTELHRRDTELSELNVVRCVFIFMCLYACASCACACVCTYICVHMRACM